MSEPTGARRYGTGGGDAYYDAVKYGGYEGTREQFGKDQAEFATNATAVAAAKEAVEQDTEEVRSTKETFVNTTVPNAIEAVQQEGADQVQAVTQQGEESSQQVETVGTEQKDAVANEGRARVQAIEQAGTDQVQAVNDAGTTQVGAVNQAGADQVGAVEQAGAGQVQAVTNEGTTQVTAVEDAGAAERTAIEEKGEQTRESIPDDYTALSDEVDNLNRQLSDVESALTESSKSFQNNSINSEYTPSVTWINKEVNPTTGEIIDEIVNTRCSSADKIPVLGYKKITWTGTTPFVPRNANIFYYDIYGRYIGTEFFLYAPLILQNPVVGFIRIQFASSTSFDASTFDGTLTLTSIITETDSKINAISDEIPLIGKDAMHKSANLFDKTTATINYYVQNSSGVLQPLANWYASDYIPVKPSTKYTMRYTNQGAFYTSAKMYISGFPGYTTSSDDNPNTVTTPDNAAYMRVSVAPLQYNGYMLEEGEEYTGFEGYGIYTLEKDAVQKWIPSVVQSKNILPELYHATTENPIRIKLLGDSITAGVGGTGYATNGNYIADTGERMNPDGYCWANLFKTYLESNFHCLVVNYAISGKNSGYYAQRASSMIETNDDIVICMLGTNDRGDQGTTTTINTIYPNLETLLNRAKEVGAKFIPMACIPADLANETTHTAHMEEVDFAINAFSADHSIEYVDVFTEMEWWCEYTGNPLSTYLDSGSLHPNDSGYLVMYKIITRALGIATKIDNANW